MALKYFTSKSNSPLVEKLSDQMRGFNNVFAPQFIVIGHNSTKDWLIKTISDRNRIIANASFKQPLEIVEIIYQVLEAGAKLKDFIKPVQLTWLIYSCLGEFISEKELKSIREYYENDQLKKFTLSEKISELFIKYQKEDPQIIKRWNSNEIGNSDDEIWQAFIWRKIVGQTNELLPDLTLLYDKINVALTDNSKVELLKKKVPVIYFFGNMDYSKELLDLVSSISNYIDVYLYRQNLIADNVNSNHQLIKTLGGFTVKQNSLFKEWNSNPEVLEFDSGKTEVTIIEHLQNSIVSQKNEPFVLKKEDDSFLINNCFSIYREVEVLYHYLVKQFKNPLLAQREVCVLVSDIDSYAPAIKTFFEKKPFHFDFTFYDTSSKVHSSPYSALEALLNFDKSNFSSKEVMALLDFEFIRSKFGINDVSTISRALQVANIRHGIEGDPDIESNYISWRYGIQRLIYGFCFPPNQEAIDIDGNVIYPIDQFEDIQTQELIKLNYFVESLDSWLLQRDKSKNLAEWVVFIDKSIDDFLDMKENESRQFNTLIGNLSVVDKLIGNDNVEFSVIQYFLISSLQKLEEGNMKGNGGIKFVSPNAFLSVPAKVYAFLGLNAKDFPRRPVKLSFDLSNPELISATDLDKHLLLNFILSAKEKCYISYVGQSFKDNSNIPPSTLIEELVSDLQSKFGSEIINQIIIKHPLHGFSSKYNHIDNPSLYRFGHKIHFNDGDLKIWQKGKDGKKKLSLEKDENDKILININNLIRFIEDPIKHYYNSVLGIYYKEEDVDFTETELFSLNNLQAWILKDRIVNENINDDIKLEALRVELMRKGEFPLKNFGKLEIEDKKIIIEDLLNFVSDYNVPDPENLKIDIYSEDSKYRVNGQIPNKIYSSEYLFYTVSTDKYKYRIRALLYYWAAKMSISSINDDLYLTYVVYKEAKTQKDPLNYSKYTYSCSSDEAKENIEKWCTFYEEGSRSLFPFSSGFKDLNSGKITDYETDKNRLKDYLFEESFDKEYNYDVSPYFKRELKNGLLENFYNLELFYNNYLSIVTELDKIKVKNT